MFSIAAISLGLLGSFHCLGMCGPIALALPLVNQNRFSKVLSILLYNGGRALTYSFFGAAFGLIGHGLSFFGLQQALSITLGILVLTFLFLPKKMGGNKTFFFATRILNKIKALFSELLSTRSLSSLFLLGLLNGLLPCGLVYMAVAGAVATGTWTNGAIFMGLFGLGTTPVMMSLSLFSNFIGIKFKKTINKAMPYVIASMAVLLFIRGLNLGIPYLSPQMNMEQKTVNCCHDKSDVNKAPAIPVCCKKR